MQRVIKCSKCKKDFIQKWINRQKQWSQLSEVLYRTNGKKWNGYQQFCRFLFKKITLLSELGFLKANKEAIIERYEKKIKEKNNEIAKLEEESKDLSDIILKVRVDSGDISKLEVLDILNRRW